MPAPPNYPLRQPKYHLMETIRPLIEVHWGGLRRLWFWEYTLYLGCVLFLYQESALWFWVDSLLLVLGPLKAVPTESQVGQRGLKETSSSCRLQKVGILSNSMV